jgi:monovalent cation:H+ antiporter-2, CPA2 family
MGIAADVAIIVVAALLGGFLALRLRLPLLIGYMAAGIVVGPHTGGITVGQIRDIELLAEIGVGLLLFGLGIEFNLQKLRRVRVIALAGTPLQLILAGAAGYWIGSLLGWTVSDRVWFGAMISVSSTAVILRSMEGQGLLASLPGRIMMGVSIVQDLAVIALVIILPEMGNPGRSGGPLAAAALRAAVFIFAMIVVGSRLVPALLRRISAWNSRELFIIAVVALGVGVGYVSHLAGLSFAFGAFVAGMVLSESDYSHQALSDLIPIRDVFGMLFFVSIGMLLDLSFLASHAAAIALTTLLVTVGKIAILSALTVAFGYRWGTAVLVGAGMFQIGEFAFVLGRTGVAHGLVSSEAFSVVLATAVTTMLATPFALKASIPLARWLDGRQRWHREEPEPAAAPFEDHVVIAGYGRVGRHVANVLHRLRFPCAVIEIDHSAVRRARLNQVPVVFYGDATRPEVLRAAGVGGARLFIVTVPTEFDTTLVVARALDLNPQLHVVARASGRREAERLARAGARVVVQPELEAGLEMVRQALVHLDVPFFEAQRYTDAVRDELRGPASPAGAALLERLRRIGASLEIEWFRLPPDSVLAGKSISDASIRQQTGVSVVALIRKDQLFSNPPPETRLEADDVVAVLGTTADRLAFARAYSGVDVVADRHEPANTPHPLGENGRVDRSY